LVHNFLTDIERNVYYKGYKIDTGIHTGKPPSSGRIYITITNSD